MAAVIVDSERHEVGFAKPDHVRIDYGGSAHVAGRFGVERRKATIGPDLLTIEVGFVHIIDRIHTEEKAAPTPRFGNLNGTAIPGKAIVIPDLGFPTARDLDRLPVLRLEAGRGDEKDRDEVVHDDRVSEIVNLRPGRESTIVDRGRGEIRSVD